MEHRTIRAIFIGIILVTFVTITLGAGLEEPQIKQLDAKSFFNLAGKGPKVDLMDKIQSPMPAYNMKLHK